MPSILEQLLFEIREAVPRSSHFAVLTSDETSFTVQAGSSREAVVTVTLEDAARPSFAVTYPELKVTRDGDESVEELTHAGVLSPAVAWIVRKVFRFGFVPPEGYHRLPRNTGRPQHP